MNNLENTKITVTINSTLLELFSYWLDRCFIKRDAFINNLISIESERLDEEMEGFKQSKEARKYLINRLKKTDTKTINVVVKKSVAIKLNDVVKKHGLSRDCFINRLLLLVTLPEGVKYELWMASSIDLMSADVDLHDGFDGIEIPTSALDGIHSYINDPLKFLRISVYEDEPGNKIYKSSFYAPEFFKHLDKKVKEGVISPKEVSDFKDMLEASSCYIADWELPKHQDYDEAKIKIIESVPKIKRTVFDKFDPNIFMKPHKPGG